MILYLYTINRQIKKKKTTQLSDKSNGKLWNNEVVLNLTLEQKMNGINI